MSGLPEREQKSQAFWAALQARPWQRKKWRTSRPDAGEGRCCVCQRPIHRTGTYYVRPAYHDGQAWLCNRCHRTMRRALGGKEDNRYSHP